MAAWSGDEERLRGVVSTDAKDQQRGAGMRTATRSRDEDGNAVGSVPMLLALSLYTAAPTGLALTSCHRGGRADPPADGPQRQGAEVANVSAKRVGADFWNLAMSLMGALPQRQI
uniref:Uncharacterized protein n=1 Tax=Oryza glumipatula TaxID=40148 RepID=A0A0E0ABH3_9ORYZ